MNPKLRLTTAHAASLVLTATLTSLSSETMAVTLGEPIAVSEIGQPLRIELPLLNGSASNAGECFRLVSERSVDGVPWVQKGRVALVMRGKASHLVITHPEPVFEPALRLAIEEVCESRLRRDYTLLLAFPSAEPAREAAGGAAATPAPEANASTARPPRGASLQPAPVTGKPSSKSGKTTLRPPTTANHGATPATSPERPRSAPEHDRLVLGGGFGDPGNTELRLSRQLDSLNRLGKISDQEREQLRREQAVLMELDRTIVAQLELNDRIRRLEEVQANMMAREQAANGAPAAAPVAPPPAPAVEAPASSGWLVPALALGGLSAALAGGLLWLRRRGTASESEFGAEDERDVEPYLAPPPPQPEPSEPQTSERAPPDFDLTREIPRPPDRPALGWETVDQTSEPAPAPAAPVIAIETTDETAEEHESAIELAEIMMGFGRIQGAAETLAEFIASNPKRAVTPWLKLLEVYRAADLRQEFDALAQQLNKTFNVKAVTWDTFEEARQSRHSMEQMSHISAKVQHIWGTEECQAYLEKLLRDNRDGKREGFPLSVIDEILVLASVLEDQLGPYRPQTTEIEHSDQWESGGQSAQDAA